MADQMNGDAKRAACKFMAVIGIAAVIGVSCLYSDNPYKIALYVAAGGVCCRIAWPNEIEGGALMDHFSEDDHG